MSVKITIDKNAVAMRLQAANEKALAITAKQVRDDCNKFCPKDQGLLIDSSFSHSKPNEGLLVWETPYARYLYYGLLMIGRLSRSVIANEGEDKVIVEPHVELNFKPPACKLWCEKARETCNEGWRNIYQNKLREGLK